MRIAAILPKRQRRRLCDHFNQGDRNGYQRKATGISHHHAKHHRLALEAGATELSPVSDMFFGAREGRVVDPFGNTWTISTHKEDIPAGEMQRRLNQLCA